MSLARSYTEPRGGKLMVMQDRRVFILQPWGGPSIQIERKSAADALRMVRAEGCKITRMNYRPAGML